MLRAPLCWLVPLVSMGVACGESSEPSDGAGAGGMPSPAGGSAGTGAPAAGGAASGRGGSGGTAGTSMNAGAGGASTAGGQGGTNAGTSGTGGAAGSAGAGTAGSMSVAGGGGVSAGTGGAAGRGSGGAPGGASNNGGGPDVGGAPNTGGCTRELLKSTTDDYFTALAAHDPSSLPLADTVKFTENGKAGELGAAGLWKTAGALKYKHSAYDTTECQTASEAVVPDGNTDIPLGLRLKVVAQKLTEIEMIAVRQGDYSVASDTAALAASATSVKWEDTVPDAQRNTRDELTGWMNKYYRMFPNGVCNTTSSCKRIENGGGNFGCSAGAMCSAGEPGPSDNALTPRLILADTETGVGVGFTLFKTGGMSYTDVHMFKMYGDQVYGVSAVLAKATSSGWD